MSDKKPKTGGRMSGFVVLFACCVALVLLAMWIYDKSETTAYHKMQGTFDVFKKEFTEGFDTKFKTLGDNVGTYDSQIKEQTDKYNKLQTEFAELDAKFKVVSGKAKNAEAECARLQEHCAKLREAQLTLQEMISNKRPIVKFSGPVPVEIFTNSDSKNTGLPGTGKIGNGKTAAVPANPTRKRGSNSKQATANQ